MLLKRFYEMTWARKSSKDAAAVGVRRTENRKTWVGFPEGEVMAKEKEKDVAKVGESAFFAITP